MDDDATFFGEIWNDNAPHVGLNKRIRPSGSARTPRLVTGDEFEAHYSELLLQYGVLLQPDRQDARGRQPKPRLEPEACVSTESGVY
jgi:hypothetical protein